MMNSKKTVKTPMETVLITGGAGYIGSLLTGVLLREGYRVKVVDEFLFGGDSLLAYLTHPYFSVYKANVTEKKTLNSYFTDVDYVIHLAAIVGFPACQQVGQQVSYLYNVQATKNVFELAEENGVKRFVFSSTYSNYGISTDGKAVNEDSPLNPQSLYAETKIAAENYLMEKKGKSVCIPTILRFATLFGLSPRMRFDLIVNQFVLEAIQKKKLIIYQKNYNRAFVHIRDIAKAILSVLRADTKKVGNQVFNVGSNGGNYSKEAIIQIIQKYIPSVTIQYKDLSFGGDMRDISVSFDKIERVLEFQVETSLEEGIRELTGAIDSGLLFEPNSVRFRNAQFIVQ